MEKTKQSLTADERGALIALYVGGVYIILNTTLKEGFSIVSPFVPSIAMLITTLSAYPIFIRGTENRWRKGKQWTFLTWSMFYAIPFSVLIFIFVSLFSYSYR